MYARNIICGRRFVISDDCLSSIDAILAVPCDAPVLKAHLKSRYMECFDADALKDAYNQERH